MLLYREKAGTVPSVCSSGVAGNNEVARPVHRFVLCKVTRKAITCQSMSASGRVNISLFRKKLRTNG
jgi:hypothetical protein